MWTLNYYNGRVIQGCDYLNNPMPCEICGKTKNAGYNGPHFGMIIQAKDLGNKNAEWRWVCSIEHGQEFIDNVLPKRVTQASEPTEI